VDAERSKANLALAKRGSFLSKRLMSQRSGENRAGPTPLRGAGLSHPGFNLEANAQNTVTYNQRFTPSPGTRSSHSHLEQ
jgi:hypothetical protein